MARIRSLKPDFFRSTSIAKLSWGARLTFQGLWCHADDDGRYRYEPALVKADVWPLDEDVTAKDAEQMVGELEGAGRICCYVVEGRRYLHIVNWGEHQKIDRKGTSKLPPCPKDTHGAPPPRRALDEPSTSPREAITEPSALDKEREREREEGSNDPVENGAHAPPRPVTVPSAAAVQEVFETWQAATGRTRARLDDKRKRRILQALRHYPPQDLLDAVRGWQHSPHHCGHNDRATVYNDLDLLLRDAAHIEQFRDLWRAGPPARAGPMNRHTREMALNHQQVRAVGIAKGVIGNGNELGAVGTDRGPPQRQLPNPADRGADSG